MILYDTEYILSLLEGRAASIKGSLNSGSSSVTCKYTPELCRTLVDSLMRVHAKSLAILLSECFISESKVPLSRIMSKVLSLKGSCKALV